MKEQDHFDIIDKQPSDNEKITENKLLSNNGVEVEILPKVGANSIVINLCSCFPISYSDSARH